ncbi:hypothetical protein ACH9EU_01005 [Kocuria sp. M1R5S2]|uniref:hypothetical protein n=1 Tax=Kocuria rhizosphaerae TaxID=3376285 RepID=UPI00378D2621
MTTPPGAPIARFVPEPPDADWETVRARLMRRLAATAAPGWTDHNPVDPGVTLAEVAAFGLADLHYRVAERRLDGWPLETRGWAADADRHWHASLPAGSLTAIANALAAPGPTSAVVLEPLVHGCASAAEAVALLSRAPWSAVLSAPLRPAVVALMRSRLVRRTAQERADVVADAVAAHRDPDDPAAGDARAAAELAFSLPLWEEEIAALVRRERRRLSREALAARLEQVRAATAATAPAVRDALLADGLDPEEARIAMAAAPEPPGTVPEDLEDPQGRTAVWPPHPVQALTCEPVTAEDYARRARAHPQVGRAWAVPGRLPGVAWNGLPTGTLSSVAVDEDAAALTLVVERVAGTGGTDAFLRAVLRAAVGPEAGAPFPDWRTDRDDLEPRRLIGDEVGASLLEDAPVLVQAVLVTGVGTDRAAVVADVRARLSAFFAAGRPEETVARPPAGVDGPWPRADQPPGGWLPGRPVRFSEVVEAVAGNPLVHGVERLAMKVRGEAGFVPQSAGQLPIPKNAVPALAEDDCLRVRFALATECHDA